MKAGFPLARQGDCIGLLGGSFDPPHAGHVHITKEAIKRFGLNRVWWLVTPSNPLKSRGPAPLGRRLEAARQVMQHPRVTVTGIEAELGTRFTAETLAALQAIYPGVRFVWIMGADNLAGFHRWERWEEILHRVPIGVLARPDQRIAARTSKAAQKYAAFRVPESEAYALGYRNPPAWSFVNVPMLRVSSTELRCSGDWPGGSQ